ncbi:MAG: carboxy terminal-processing peptidase, partial [Kiritimatiellae bacterium]|nr:carboxy terminal-processing peptidase [Kiritimatiellia bacterium]
MRRVLRLLVGIFILFVSLNVMSAERAPLKPQPEYAKIVKRLAQELPREHITRMQIDAAVSARIWTNYLASLDYDRVYFLASDIARFKSWEMNLGNKLKEGDVNFAYEVFGIFKERVANRCQYVNQLVDKGFDFEKDEFCELTRKNAPWPRDETDWNEIWRKRIKNDYLQRIIGAEMAEKVPKPPKQENTNTVDQARVLPPHEMLKSRYKQLATAIEDSDSEWVLQRYLTAVAHAYDPHSDYMSPSVLEDFNIEMKLSLVGIGALLGAEDGAAKIMRVIPGGPAARDKRDVRLVPGDKIIAVGQGNDQPRDILHLPLREIVKLIRGKKGTKVTLVVIPASDPTGTTTKIVDLERDEVKLEEQAAKHKVEQSVGEDGVIHKLGVVTLPAFYADIKAKADDGAEAKSSVVDVERALEDLKAKGIEGIILDLRNNGGGYLPEAIGMTGLFISMGPVVQVAEGGSTRSTPAVLSDRDPSVAYAGPLVVLVNRFSASASEILAGALQDYGRALIVGDSKTHGKGTVQSILDMSRDGKLGSIKVTAAMYYRINGGSTQLKGVHPDIVIPSPFDKMEFGEEYLPNPLPWSVTNEVPYLSVDTKLKSLIPVLVEKSEKRRAADAKYSAYLKLLGNIESINKLKEVPLSLSKRKDLA